MRVKNIRLHEVLRIRNNTGQEKPIRPVIGKVGEVLVECRRGAVRNTILVQVSRAHLGGGDMKKIPSWWSESFRPCGLISAKTTGYVSFVFRSALS